MDILDAPPVNALFCMDGRAILVSGWLFDVANTIDMQYKPFAVKFGGPGACLADFL